MPSWMSKSPQQCLLMLAQWTIGFWMADLYRYVAMLSTNNHVSCSLNLVQHLMASLSTTTHTPTHPHKLDSISDSIFFHKSSCLQSSNRDILLTTIDPNSWVVTFPACCPAVLRWRLPAAGAKATMSSWVALITCGRRWTKRPATIQRNGKGWWTRS